MRIRLWTMILGGAVLLGLVPIPGEAQLPSVNLGFTSFLDGGPPAGPGFYFQEYVQYYNAGNFRDADGDEQRIPSPPGAAPGRLLDDLNVWVSLNQFIYQSAQQIVPGGGRWGMDVIVPLVSLDVDPGPGRFPNGDKLSDNNEGLGDILIGPYIQWDPIMGKNGPLFIHRIELQNLVPTGKYDDGRVINPGSNFYSFNPYWAATFFATPQWEITWRLHYLWNAENDDPLEDLYGDADETQAGHAVHVNFASSYEVLPKRLRLGINGYYLEQIADNEIEGVDVDKSREKVLALGPGGVLHLSQNDHLFFNSYFETEAENRTEGMRFNFRWTHHF